MKISCDVIKDLLPQYHDAICSDDSRKLVEEHIKECDACKAELSAMDKELDVYTQEENLLAAKEIKKLSTKWKREKMKSFIKGTLLTVLILLLSILILYLFLDIRIIS